MRKKIVAGNWKMNKNYDEGIELFISIQQKLRDYHGECKTVVIPPFIHISRIRELIEVENLFLGGQNISDKPSGAFTGEISADMLWSVGANYVIIGHSERRKYFGETNQTCAQKINLAIENKLVPIYCVGEVVEQRKSGIHFKVIEQQINEGIFVFGLQEFKEIVIAYEPVWAIGTGLTATKEQAQEVHAFIRELISKKYTEKIAQNTTILYGGSCNPSNAEDLFSQSDVDGGLIGGASLNADDFIAIIKANK